MDQEHQGESEKEECQPVGKAKRQADRRGDQLLEIAGWKRFVLDWKI
jgi:hypothetical protein